ncbi:NADP-dependent malic enzyme [Lactiplantibacillus plantarum]|uniref:NAD(P)-dependent malic enzyme n=1 Tax=Lactiplantibacillus plantarum TaxID=1590 RepID=UPI0001E590E0|nr:malic enzyme-like NAD(P)-binding protein [Lactiplantibacillus plantarum]ADN98105.1 malic enzyme, NAD-dependent [Lactiplantibacillus plantarum ST-III]ATL78277.1 NADP-dependent malic enzyme [Lactiplantibacillus plantarum]KZD99297.1 Oxaloacetate decarboxylase involved in citrate fermentation [Lactiplantibacillus plantarum]MBO2725699.1 NAD-dependent malic enzyme [Lactiplantibacillus plantarum]MDO7838689.1 malic enzyme-like NAD(P)-binding protein [Lactiplantibacillus plantarum]
MVEQDEILKLHAAHTGVLDIHSDLAVTDKADLGKAYTPGVAVISKLIAAHPELKAKYTMSGKLVALITDGSAVLGLGNIGPAGGLPVVEGKALLYKNLAGINAIPLALNQVSVPAMVATIKNMSLSFAGIHLEDITAPKCFELEAALKDELDIPVYHDDQEGTAIVVLAGLINAAHVVGKSLRQMRIVVNGVGASGLATARLLAAVGVKQLTLVDVYGVVTADDQRYNQYQRNLAKQLGTPAQLKGQPLAKVMADQDVFIGLSDANVLSVGAVHLMNHDPIVFALANPVPEINPAVAEKAGATVIATGSSQYPNQVNNILAFPGLFKGLLTNGVKQVDNALQIQVAQALAKTVSNPTATTIVPSVFDSQVVPNVTAAVATYAQAQH